ncbi:MAG TPA: hypothetical protein VNO52_05325, partial [Methylomirabilota bacterium]|nr:hypothetical protein [Methylomirabilota bacterium]
AYTGPAYYNPLAPAGKQVVTAFVQGKKTDYRNSDVDWGTAGAPSANASFESLTQAQKLQVAAHLGYEYDAAANVYFNYLADADNRVRTEFVQGEPSDYSNDRIYWGAAGAPSADAPFSSLSDAQKQRVAESLRYTKIDAPTVYYNPNAAPSQRVLTSLAGSASNDYSNDSIDWGGVLKPADDATFESLSFDQRAVVATFLSYAEFKGLVYYNPGAVAAKQWLQTFAAGTDYENDEIDWGEDVPEPASNATFDDLTLDQKRVVAQSLGYIEFLGVVYHNPSAAIDKRFRLTFEEGAGKDYENEYITWSVVEVPQPGTAFNDLTDAQKRHVIKQLGYTLFEGTVYYDSDHPTRPLVTTFVQGVDYSNAGVGLSGQLVNNRWVITDGTNEYLLYAFDPEGDGIFDEIHIREQHQLFGQRGFGFLLTGTVTSLQDGQNITVEGSRDAIMRGAFKLLGANSNLTVQSDKWIYWEGVADITGNLRLFGGMELDGTNVNGANAKGYSVYVHETASLVTAGAGTNITVRGGQDVYLGGVTVAGGKITATGINWAGPDSTVEISAGQQLYIGTTVVAAKSVTVSGGTPGAGDNGLSVIVATDGGLVTPGLTSTANGGTVTVNAAGDLQLMGGILSGGTSNNDVITWGAKPSNIRIEATGQAWIGGQTVDINNNPVEVGGKLFATQKIEIIGGSHPSDGVGVKMPGSAYVTVRNANGEIHITSTQDAVVSAVLAAGGEIIMHKDPDNFTLGVTVNSFDGDSVITITAGNRITIGRNLMAGKRIDLRGGSGPAVQIPVVDHWDDDGLVLFGSSHVTTSRPNSVINISGAGDLSLLAPAWSDEILAAGFAQYADGHITQDVTLVMEINLGTHTIRGSVVLTAASTVGNTGLASLRDDLQAALNSTTFTVIQSVSGTPAVNSTQTTNEITVSLSDGRLLLTSAYPFKLKSTSVNPATLGFTQVSSGDAASYRNYAVDAPADGAVVNFGSASLVNGKISIEGWVRAHSGLNFLSNGASLGLQDLNFGVTGKLETLSGGMNFNLGNDAILRGSLVARGPGADVVLAANRSLEIYGDITAQDDILISTTGAVVPGQRSIYTHGTSELKTLDDDGVIRITGVNDVVINSVIGSGLPTLKLLEITSTDGTMKLEKESGQLLTGAQLNLAGRLLDIAGVVTSTRATPATTDNEVILSAVDNILLGGTLTLQGSMLVTSQAHINLSNIRLIINNPGQHLIVEAAGDVRLGNTMPEAGFSAPTATVLQADAYVQFNVGGNVVLGYDAQIYSSADTSIIRIEARGLVVVGTIYAGASFNASAP